MAKGNMNNHDVRKIYAKIREESVEQIEPTLDEELVQEMETLPATSDTLSKPIIIKKLVMMTKFPKELLRKMEDANLRMIYDGLMSVGKARVIKALKGEALED